MNTECLDFIGVKGGVGSKKDFIQNESLVHLNRYPTSFGSGRNISFQFFPLA
jgi:hypothetical protein